VKVLVLQVRACHFKRHCY